MGSFIKVFQTPLQWAAHNGDMEMVMLLILSGADVNAKAVSIF